MLLFFFYFFFTKILPLNIPESVYIEEYNVEVFLSTFSYFETKLICFVVALPSA